MPAPVVRVEGADRLRATMRAAGLKLRDLSAVNRRTAAKVVAASAPAAPRRTGALAASVRPQGTQRIAAARSTLIYAPVIHFGWPRHNISPQPFIYDAVLGIIERGGSYLRIQTAGNHGWPIQEATT